jgi:hypothetical protein
MAPWPKHGDFRSLKLSAGYVLISVKHTAQNLIGAIIAIGLSLPADRGSNQGRGRRAGREPIFLSRFGGG